MPSSNSSAQEQLAHMLEQGTIPHALLFCGPEGVGKGAHALKCAESLMGPSAVDKIHSGNHPDLHVLRPEGKAGLHPVESIRSLLKEAALPPFEAPVKVFIIYDAHQMLPASSNALLKTLEEPPPRTYFFLLTSQPESLLPTIVSRCRKIAFSAPGSSERASHALVRSLVSLSLPRDYAQLLTLCEEVEKNIGETDVQSALEPLLEDIFAWYRDLQLIKHGLAPGHLYHSDAIQLLQERAKNEIQSLELILNELLKVLFALQRHVKVRVVLEHFFLAIT